MQRKHIYVHPHIACKRGQIHKLQQKSSRNSQYNYKKLHISNENVQLISRLRFPLPRAGFIHSFYRFFIDCMNYC